MTRPRNLIGLWRACVCFSTLFAGLVSGCARDVNKGQNQEEPFPVQLDFTMELDSDPSVSTLENWYYFVFNFGTLNATEQSRPLDQIIGADRGENWEMYVAFHVDPATGDTVAITDRRDRGPTLLATAAGPVDAAVGNFNPATDPASDILVAARDGNAIQLFLGETETFRDNIYYEDATTVNTGPAPMRIFSSSPSMGSFPAAFTTTTSITPLDLDGDEDQDAVVILAGSGGGAVIRPLISNGDGLFSAGTETPVPGIPIDAIFAELDSPGVVGSPDLAILTVDSAGGAGTVRVFTGAAGGTFAAGPTFAVGTDPVQIAGGLIDEGNDIDIVVANAGSDDISVFFGGAGAAFTSDSTLDVPGDVRGVSVNNFSGTGGDVAFSFDETGASKVGVYLREAAGPFAAAPITREMERPAGPIITFDAGNDTRPDVLNLDASGSADGNIVIERGESVIPEGGGTAAFGWAESPIIYPTGNTPTRIIPVDFEGDNDIDLIVPNSGTGSNGNSIGVYLSLGRYQFSDINIYWTDAQEEPPQDLTIQPWYVGHAIQGRQITLTVDATQFLSLADLPPEELLRNQTSRNYFIIDMMTADTAMDFLHKPRFGNGDVNQDIGTVTENFTTPVVVPMTIGFLDNNATHAVVDFPAAPPERNIRDWQIEAN